LTSGAPQSNGSSNGRANGAITPMDVGRGLVPGLPTPHPFGPSLPAVFQEDDFAQRFVSAFDDVLAPIFCAMDNGDAYLDPHLAPEDFLEWMSTWVGIELDETWPIERRRALVAKAVELYRWRGTVKGLVETVAIYANAEPEIIESGGITASTSPGTKFPGTAKAEVTVRVQVKDPSTIDVARLERLVEASKPAHILAKVEVKAG
jgi:phage tail-like protein